MQILYREGSPLALTPVGAARFKVEGAPSGFFVEFTIEGSAATGMRAEEGPNERETFRRKP